MNDEILSNKETLDGENLNIVSLDNRKVIIQSFDLVVDSLIQQLGKNEITLDPTFQRRLVWAPKVASRLIESIILNVPIPPCYLSQNSDYQIDVIDGQQRLSSIYRYMSNEFKLSGLNIIHELNGKRFSELPEKIQRKLRTHVIRCVLITLDSHPDIKYEIFERLNTETYPLRPQELRNCIYRGPLNELLNTSAKNPKWLQILGKKIPDKRMNGEELVLRYFSYLESGLKSYSTPFKNWLNITAQNGMNYSPQKISELDSRWKNMLEVSLIWFEPDKCFRRPGVRNFNKVLFDLIADSASQVSSEYAKDVKNKFEKTYTRLFDPSNEFYDEFDYLISHATDAKSLVLRRFEIWNIHFNWIK